MPPTFFFDVDAARDLVSVTVGGFFMPEDVQRFGIARQAAHRRLTCGPNQHLTLIDMRAMQIQSQQAVEAFAEVLHSPEHYSRRIAMVVSQTLARLQVQRAARGRSVEYFADDLEAARRWLLEREARAA